VDISIVDRLALLTKLVQSVGEGQHFPSSVASSYSPFHLNKSGKAAMFQQVLQDHDSVKTELDFSIGISHLKVINRRVFDAMLLALTNLIILTAFWR